MFTFYIYIYIQKLISGISASELLHFNKRKKAARARIFSPERQVQLHQGVFCHHSTAQVRVASVQQRRHRILAPYQGIFVSNQFTNKNRERAAAVPPRGAQVPPRGGALGGPAATFREILKTSPRQCLTEKILMLQNTFYEKSSIILTRTES